MKSLPNKINYLNQVSASVNIPKYIYFNFKSFNKNKQNTITQIKKKFKNKIIIRSASYEEDNKKSNAGKYLSISNIEIKNSDLIKKSIEKVFNSYGKSKENQFVLIQEYIKNAESVGVIFSADQRNGSPFRTINFNNSNHTELITSGKSNGQIIYYYNNIKKEKLKSNIFKIEKVIRKLEKKFPKIHLDIEFLILKKKIYILQVRPLNIRKTKKINYKKSLNDLQKKISKMISEKSHLVGNDRYFSTMTDWNPAEIIGLKPKPLATSLYQSLITDEVWSESRVSLGYKDVTKIPLLYSFLGTPYIDLKTDINSFLVSNLSDKIQQKLLNFYFKEFKKKPYFFYDKIESSLVINCVSLDIEKYKKILSDAYLSKKEISEIINQYINLTSNIIIKLGENIKKYEHGENIFKKLKNSKNSTVNKIFLLHNVCKNYGTLPFANIARMGFVAVEFLNSFETLNIISKKEKNHFLETIKSVSFDMSKSLRKSKKIFIEKYGHLRPNTYEISTKNYKEDFNNYFQNITAIPKKPKKFKFSSLQKLKINKILKHNKFKNIDADLLVNFIENSIYHRENSKLFFTKIIDEIFSQLRLLSKRIGLKQNDIEYLNIKKILNLYEQFYHKDIIFDIRNNILENKRVYKFNKNFNLPNIIIKKDDIYLFEEEKASPTFISEKIVSSKIIFIKKITKKLNLENKIVCIRNADPGYEFIFNHKIKGLITAFGGPNSHMSIRCNEFSLPAAIGIGEKKFEELIKKNTLYLNCKKKMLSGI